MDAPHVRCLHTVLGGVYRHLETSRWDRYAFLSGLAIASFDVCAVNRFIHVAYRLLRRIAAEPIAKHLRWR